MNNKNSLKQLMEVTLFSVIVVLLAFLPIGYIPIGIFKMTTVHIPVIIASLILGWKKGAIVGFIFGLTSLINNTFISPSIISFVFSPFYENAIAKGNFWSLIICFIPRILTGVTPYFTYKILNKIKKLNESIKLALSGGVGALTNTILVMSLIYIFFGEEYAAAKEVEVNRIIFLILYTIFTNGILEIISSAIIVVAICKVLKKRNI